MNTEQFNNLSEGDVVRGKMSGQGYIVSGNYGDRVTATRTIDMSNPVDWELVAKADYKYEKQ